VRKSNKLKAENEENDSSQLSELSEKKRFSHPNTIKKKGKKSNQKRVILPTKKVPITSKAIK
jgi:hypothetical protein